ncbi:uncharacterized protein LOC117002499 isoform X2 [Catharus ustulatus]|uniref:uncharacterized protein LOC117002499 isoform X2 n=1 Tax=Catharus ustulatus TaxID=91951 RepID=UPI00140A21C0|nr:uncharacterized protein LOC117002499 isoform X2 [Catharus ustulatus]
MECARMIPQLMGGPGVHQARHMTVIHNQPLSAKRTGSCSSEELRDWGRDMDNLEALLEYGLKFLEDVFAAEPAGEGDLVFQPTSRTEHEENGEEMKPEVVQKEAFPRGSSGSVPASAVGREAMTGQAPRKASPLAWLHKGLKPLEPPAGISFPAPFLSRTRKPSSHRKGLPTGKIRDTVNKKTLEPPEATEQMLKEVLQGKQVMDPKSVQREAIPRGNSGSVPASTAGGKAMPGTEDGVARKAPPFAWQYKVLKPSVPPAGMFSASHQGIIFSNLERTRCQKILGLLNYRCFCKKDFPSFHAGFCTQAHQPSQWSSNRNDETHDRQEIPEAI